MAIGSVPARRLPESRGWSLYPILAGCSFESDCAFNSARARCVTRVGDAGRDRQAVDSRRGSVIVPQKSTQPITTSHRFVAAGFRNLAEKQHVVLTLLISLSMR
jgi:hypothetical protein